MSEITHILERINLGDAKAAEDLPGLVYNDLRRLAAQKMLGEACGNTLQPTALVHEAWLRLGADAQPQWRSRGHFFAAAAEAMRRILVERARRRAAAKRGAGAERIDVDRVDIPMPMADDELLKLNEALDRFTTVSPRKAELIKLRYFVGMNFEEAGAALGIAVPTAKKWWAYARAWLEVEMKRRD